MKNKITAGAALVLGAVEFSRFLPITLRVLLRCEKELREWLPKTSWIICNKMSWPESAGIEQVVFGEEDAEEILTIFLRLVHTQA